MKTLIFNGSPRTNGDTVYLINELTRRLTGEVKIIDAYSANIKPCMACRYCWQEPSCIIQDKMQEVYAYIKECDNIVIASPIYFSELTGPLLSVLSRLQVFYAAKYIRDEALITKKKKGAVILCGGGGGSPKRAQATAKIILSEMKATDYWGAIVSHNTDTVPSKDDLEALLAVQELADEWNKIQNI